MAKAADEIELHPFEEEPEEEEEAGLLGRKPKISHPRETKWTARLARLGIVIAFGILLSYAATAYLFSRSLVPNTLRQARNILFTIAHPDDESLFFTPSVTSVLQRSEVKGRGHLLVMSSGNNYGLGQIRREELKGSCDALGLISCVSLDTQ